jgi:hypothetical protein
VLWLLSCGSPLFRSLSGSVSLLKRRKSTPTSTSISVKSQSFFNYIKYIDYFVRLLYCGGDSERHRDPLRVADLEGLRPVHTEGGRGRQEKSRTK